MATFLHSLGTAPLHPLYPCAGTDLTGRLAGVRAAPGAIVEATPPDLEHHHRPTTTFLEPFFPVVEPPRCILDVFLRSGALRA
jgi:hypothetical protein